jgi:hypothetical protein
LGVRVPPIQLALAWPIPFIADHFEAGSVDPRTQRMACLPAIGDHHHPFFLLIYDDDDRQNNLSSS